ncbi:glycoside hydrolase family 53 protein [Viridothelium virens]|uniref:Arabinogalactan endo-beta-1,4-galactanase n=1 Tax=Viridothelium virens TaxID=1048519 RepID=A0A6A6GVN3_VIRVR|nr:glycoside hydrolase family 53 protein [Viridothelium virens]
MLGRFLFRTLPFLAAMSGAATAIVHGHDLSSVTQMEQDQGANWYTTSGQKSTIESILGDGGMDSVRLRLWTADEYGLSYTLALAQRFYKEGYKIYLDMHFSDNWADPSKQAIPAAWSSSSITTLASQLQTYVRQTLTSFHNGGVQVEILALGNEIRNGMLWPLGQISGSSYTNFAILWAAARAGVNDAVSAGVPKPQVMIHLDDGWNESLMASWFKGVFATGKVKTSDVDVFGFSFYPFYGTSATISNLQASLNNLASTYGKPMYVAETDWPVECSGVSLSANYPTSAQGQTEWVQAIESTLTSVPNGLGAGLFYWEPGFLNDSSLGSSCTSALLFDVDWSGWPTTKATALSSVNMYK